MSRKLDYELAVEAFEEADKKYRAMEESFLNGEYLKGALSNPDSIINYHQAYLDRLRQLLDERNAKLADVKHVLRSAVQLGPSQWRGPDGLPTVVECGEFRVSSATRRSFDPESLLNLAARNGRMEKLLSLKSIDKDGREQKAVQQTYQINYKTVIEWIKAEHLEGILKGAYEEKEDTPKVHGPKPLSFLGDRKDKE